MEEKTVTAFNLGKERANEIYESGEMPRTFSFFRKPFQVTKEFLASSGASGSIAEYIRGYNTEAKRCFLEHRRVLRAAERQRN